MPKWLKYSLWTIAGLVVLSVLLVIGTLVYITYNKDKVLKMVSSELNEKLDGKIIIGDMRPQFFKRFPNVSLELNNVKILNHQFDRRRRTLRGAGGGGGARGAGAGGAGGAGGRRSDV